MGLPAARFFPLLTFSLLGITAGCSSIRQAEIAGLLFDFNRDERMKQSAAEVETRNFRKAQKAFLGSRGCLPPLDEAAAEKLFGKPVITFARGDCRVWGYKPASGDWFSGEKIYLTFNARGRLIHAEYRPS